jgi:hypothetical protein
MSIDNLIIALGAVMAILEVVNLLKGHKSNFISYCIILVVIVMTIFAFRNNNNKAAKQIVEENKEIEMQKRIKFLTDVHASDSARIIEISNKIASIDSSLASQGYKRDSSTNKIYRFKIDYVKTMNFN